MPAFPLFQLPVREQGLCRRQSFLEQGVLKGIMGSIVLNTRIHWKQDCSLEASSQIPRKLRAHLNISCWHMLPYGGRCGKLISAIRWVSTTNREALKLVLDRGSTSRVTEGNIPKTNAERGALTQGVPLQKIHKDVQGETKVR